ncbi:hypothetical protein KPA96_13635 [Burkholderia cenocepacia]|uniref:hypothetical protein n=1 Tax=Burkholderia cenocepacia TaxID=95486 RepID=UPI00286379F3|nr:hypothetical protein [Burkholderia cenocepacia]MCB4346792.1 hypothetical protein [Burkholderia vietnamiensis]MDR8076698.1 hypothetical protein [Burkholderia cenocepacia]
MKSVRQYNETDKQCAIVYLANALLNDYRLSKKTGLFVKSESSYLRDRYRDLNIFNQAFDLSRKYANDVDLIERLEPIVSRGRNGKFEGVKVIYKESV